jgi:alkylation response protein AidB-like acyl-CoA dehydrogenase
MALPKSLGGLETDPLTMLRVVEEIASFDSIAAWLLMVSNGGSIVGGRFPAATVEQVFADPNDCLIGTAFQPGGEAQAVGLG